MTPEELLYARTHEWAYVQTDGAGAKTATVGLSRFALEALTDLVFLGLPEVGRTVRAGESFGEIESVKAVSDLFSPVNGEVIEVNETLGDNLEHLADDPYTAGWMVKIKVTNEAGLTGLLDFAAYQKHCQEEA